MLIHMCLWAIVHLEHLKVCVHHHHKGVFFCPFIP